MNVTTPQLETGIQPMAVLDSGFRCFPVSPGAASQAQLAVTSVANQSIYLGGFTLQNVGTASSGTVTFTVISSGVLNYSESIALQPGQSYAWTLCQSVVARLGSGADLTVTIPAGAANSQWLLNVFYNQG